MEDKKFTPIIIILLKATIKLLELGIRISNNHNKSNLNT
jgi:hypothetical protein